jgi:AcrR family transcriptional regulator
VTSRRWLREGRSDLASDRILDAAAAVFVRQGVARTSMADVAREAGCSRATLYRYFDDRPALRTAFVHREARRLAAEVAAEIAGLDDLVERTVEAVMLCVSKVRDRPTLHAWFAAGNVGITRDLIDSSDVIEGVAAAFLGRTGDPEEADWLVRTVVSLVVLPGTDADSERSMLRRFVAPALRLGACGEPSKGSVPGLRALLAP